MSCRPDTHPSKLLAGLYSASAREYAELWAPVLQPTSERLIAAMPLAAATTVLDLGAGTGALFPALRAAAPSAAKRDTLMDTTDKLGGLLEDAGLTVSRVWMECPERRWTWPQLLELTSRYEATSRRLATLDPASRGNAWRGSGRRSPPCRMKS